MEGSFDEDFELVGGSERPKQQLRKSQIKCLHVMERIVKNGIYNFSLHTGSGKSKIIATFVNRHKNKRHLLLVPSIQILYQFSLYFQEALPTLHYTEATKEEQERQSYITITVYNSIDKVIDNKYDYVHIDEAHHIYQPEIIRLLEKENNNKEDLNYIQKIQTLLKCNYQFNFSATFGRVNFSFHLSMNDALKEKIITDYRLHIVMFGKKTQDLNKLKGDKIIIYCKTIQECIDLSRQLGCNYLSGEMSLKERKRLIDDFKQNHKFLCSCRTISEGVDLPFVSGAIFYSEKRSQVNIIQCIGRAQRLYPGKTLSHIYVILKQNKQMNYNRIQANLSKYCSTIAEYDKDIKDKIDVMFLNDDPLPDETIKKMKENVFKFCRLCCHKLRIDELDILELCKQFYSKHKRVPKIDEIVQDKYGQPFKIGKFIHCVKNNRFGRIQNVILIIFKKEKIEDL